MSTIKVGTLLAADGSTTTQPSIPALDQRMAKAWVNFNGTGTVAINASYNVSSLVDDGVGLFTINFQTALPNIYYSVAMLATENDASSHGSNLDRIIGQGRVARNTGHIKVVTQNLGSLAEQDCLYNNVMIFGS